MSKHRRRPQAQKPNRHSNPEMAAAMRELRRSNATVPHKMRNRIERGDFRKMVQRGRWDD